MSHQIPKTLRVIKFFQMTKLVDNYIVSRLFWQEDKLVIKIKIAFFRTTPPPRFLVSNTNSIKFKTIKLIKMIYTFFNQNQSLRFVFCIIPFSPPWKYSSKYNFKIFHFISLLLNFFLYLSFSFFNLNIG